MAFPDPTQVDFVGPANFLTLDLHWQAVVRHLAQLTGVAVTPEELTVVCVTKAAGDGSVDGSRHTDPLLPTDQRRETIYTNSRSTAFAAPC